MEQAVIYLHQSSKKQQQQQQRASLSPSVQPSTASLPSLLQASPSRADGPLSKASLRARTKYVLSQYRQFESIFIIIIFFILMLRYYLMSIFDMYYSAGTLFTS